MALSYVGGQAAGRTNPSAASVVNYNLQGGSNTTPSAGDLLVVAVVVGSANGTPTLAVTTPSCTALTQQNQNSTADTSMNVSWKILAANELTSVTIPGSTNNAWGEAYSIQVFRGAAAAPMDATPVITGGTGTGRPDPDPITPVTAGAWVVICGGGAAGTGAAYVAPANFGTNWLGPDAGTDNTDAMVGSGYWTGWSSGQVDPAAYTGGTTGATDTWAAFTLAIKPFVAVTHSTSGVLASQGSDVDGAASSATERPSSGVLVGQGSDLDGVAARTREHANTGVLASQGAGIVGASSRSGGASATLSGSVTESIDEADIVAGGETIVLTLIDDTWIPV